MRSTVSFAACLLGSLLCCSPALASKALATKAGCMVCHSADKKLIGPSFRDVASKYKGHADAAAVLTAAVRNGSKGVWGKVAMPPTAPARISDADLHAVILWVLKQ